MPIESRPWHRQKARGLGAVVVSLSERHLDFSALPTVVPLRQFSEILEIVAKMLPRHAERAVCLSHERGHGLIELA